ncbi:uncharacterized protein LOC143237887 isoform X2 [Tachypleus tridentatus]|uniref:uncharacterized protein LOC143237887 isoform X2 n=1 Tax=Tachypleus tridentatus TaxID=6853 RepID=UPI003FD1924C
MDTQSKRRLILLSLLLLCGFRLSLAQYFFNCAEDYCEKRVKCEKITCDKGRIVKNATECSCCHNCVNLLKEGDKCETERSASIPRLECGAGLVCDNSLKKCVKASTECMKKQANFVASGFSTGPPPPSCDHFGEYEAVQCKSGLFCYCVDKNGKQIFGIAPDTEKKSMKCDCSRAVTSFGKPLEPTELPRCKSNGNYEAIQKTRRYWFCVDENGQLEESPIFLNRTLSTLPCYDDKIHRNYQLLPPCYEDRNTLIKEIRNRESQGFTVVGIDLPTCDPDGTYAPKQSRDNKSYCVDKGGKIINNTTVSRYSEEAKEMFCNCVRVKLLLKNKSQTSGLQDIFSEYRCDKNGNYLPMQCTPHVCYCVDSVTGFQIEKTVLPVNKNDLSCWKPEYET